MGGVEGFWPSGGGLRSAMLRSPLRVGCRVKGVSGGQPAVRPPVVDSVHRWGGKGGLRPRGLRPLIYPPRPSTHPNLGALRGGGVTSGLFRWGDRRTSSARGMIGRTTSASLVSLRGRRAQHEYEPVHTPRKIACGDKFNQTPE